MTDLLGLSQLSIDVYEEVNRASSPGYTEVTGAFDVDSDTGFQANAYYNSSTNTLVIAYAGTDWSLTNWEDIGDDAVLALGGLPEQAPQAISYAEQIIQDFEDPNNPDLKIVFSGHSLGGYLAQHTHLTLGRGSAVVFNSPGVNSNTQISGAPSVTYVFSNPTSWGTSNSIHTLGDYIGEDYFFAMDAVGHGIASIRNTLGADGQSPLSLSQIKQVIIEEIEAVQFDSDITSIVDTWAIRGVIIDALLEALEETGKYCFRPGTKISMWPTETAQFQRPQRIIGREDFLQNAWEKSIEAVKEGDVVVSFDFDGNLVPGVVTRLFRSDAKTVLDLHGTHVTPGHVYYRADSKKPHKFETLIDILRDDGVIQMQDGTLIRASTNAPVGDRLDGFVQAVTGTRNADGSLTEKERGRIRLGTRFIVDGTRSYCVADLIDAAGGTVDEDELIRVGDSASMAFHWEFDDALPKPEDFVLACSGTTLEDIYRVSEWEGARPHLPAPLVRDGGPVQPLREPARALMPRNQPLGIDQPGPGNGAKPRQ
ncbi:hypothetical protein JANAI62_37680 [Jannaschia pagri]|uniref:Lipase (Class 3) n=1 Tax=Jannaschia pagri TaxID=2829797 RepID=A0ABQ4NRV8_9RHOB|nr:MULTISPECIES: Mbeg1-like protein [unclassified Jannaschia]GIT93325.1 hypothetical protein JANAI61_37830 [Jannaschia sp. AI_61]GIT97145.1 hypothetical protein JANAI62_37680 [Jannaschia sp. AI_62]